MDKINSAHIVRLKSFLTLTYHGYMYKPEVKFLSLLIRKGGFYDTYRIESSCLSKEELEIENTNLYVVDNMVYYKPHIVLFLSNSTTKTVWFKTEQELNSYLEREEIKNIKWI